MKFTWGVEMSTCTQSNLRFPLISAEKKGGTEGFFFLCKQRNGW